MNLKNFGKIDNAIKATNLIFVFAMGIMAAAFTIAFFYLSTKIDEAYTKALVIDTKGAAYEATPILAADMRKYEFENHVKSFIHLWYAFDENNYESNIKAALHLIGNRGKELLNEYNDLGIATAILQKNLRYGIAIEDISVDMTAIPVAGTATVTQTGYRAKGSLSRKIFVEFSLYEVARSRENVHGVKIEDWNVRYSKPPEKEAEQKTEENEKN